MCARATAFPWATVWLTLKRTRRRCSGRCRTMASLPRSSSLRYANLKITPTIRLFLGLFFFWLLAPQHSFECIPTIEIEAGLLGFFASVHHMRCDHFQGSVVTVPRRAPGCESVHCFVVCSCVGLPSSPCLLSFLSPIWLCLSLQYFAGPSDTLISVVYCAVASRVLGHLIVSVTR